LLGVGRYLELETEALATDASVKDSDSAADSTQSIP
jgi:hypothetical protein